MGLSDKTLKSMLAYYGSGNIRELENVIERSVLLARDSIIDEVLLPATPKGEKQFAVQEIRMKTIHENEREYILQVLKNAMGGFGILAVL